MNGLVGRQTPHLSAAGRSRLPTWRGEAEDVWPARASVLSCYTQRCETDGKWGSAHPYSDITEVAGIGR